MSFTVFALSQFTMDLEVLGRLVLGAEQLHGFTNTVIGATVIAVPTILLGRPLCQAVLKWWNSKLSPAQAKWFSVEPVVTWKAASIGGVIGVYSHVVLDAVMHVDAHPWAPFSRSNPFVGLLSVERLNALCLWSIAIGIGALGAAELWKRWRVRRMKGLNQR